MTFKALITEKTDDGYQSRVGDKNLEDLPEGDVLVRVAWSSLNYKDALSASGNKGVTRSFPHTPGIDAAGVVEEAGDGPFSVGDAVICTGYDLGMNTSGGYGDYIRVPAEWLAPLPAGLSARDAMVLGTAGLTAALRGITDLPPPTFVRPKPSDPDSAAAGAHGRRGRARGGPAMRFGAGAPARRV